MGSGMTTEPGSRRWDRLSLWFSIFIGPLAWAADFALGDSLTGRACAAQNSGFLLVSSVVAAAAATAGLVRGLRAHRTRPPPGRANAKCADPSRFLVLSAIILSGGFLLAILAAALPRFIVDSCA